MARCTHVMHSRSVVMFKTQTKDKDVKVPVVLGYCTIRREYQLCDEGFIPNSAKLKKLNTEEV